MELVQSVFERHDTGQGTLPRAVLEQLLVQLGFTSEQTTIALNSTRTSESGDAISYMALLNWAYGISDSRITANTHSNPLVLRAAAGQQCPEEECLQSVWQKDAAEQLTLTAFPEQVLEDMEVVGFKPNGDAFDVGRFTFSSEGHMRATTVRGFFVWTEFSLRPDGVWESLAGPGIDKSKLQQQLNGDWLESHGLLFKPAAHVRLSEIRPRFSSPGKRLSLQPISCLSTVEGRFPAAVRSGVIRLLRGAYVERSWRQKKPLQMQQELSADALWPPAEAGDMWLLYGHTFFFAMSYGWLHPSQNDPEMYHLERLARILLELREAQHTSLIWARLNGELDPSVVDPLSDICLFKDWCSLPQEDPARGIYRTVEQQAAFQEGLGLTSVIYGHAAVTVLLCSGVPAHIPRKYNLRGWPLFESCLANTKPSSILKCFTFDDNFDLATSAHGLDFFINAAHSQSPPCSPETFNQELESREQVVALLPSPHNKLFQNGKDYDVVKKMYEDAWAPVCGVASLTYVDCQWTDEQIQLFVRVLPTFTHLKELSLQSIDLRQNVGSVLAAVPLGLEVLRLMSCGTGVTFAEVVSGSLCRFPNLHVLSLTGNRGTGDMLAQNIATAAPGLCKLNLYKTDLSDEGALALAGALPPYLWKLEVSSCAVSVLGALALARAESLGALIMHGNGFTDLNKQTLQEAWLAEEKDLIGLNL